MFLHNYNVIKFGLVFINNLCVSDLAINEDCIDCKKLNSFYKRIILIRVKIICLNNITNYNSRTEGQKRECIL